jgi:colanic acid biosynthesis glycosyl transferase WcaI
MPGLVTSQKNNKLCKLMKILIVSQYFYPESFRVNDFAIGMRERGHEVTVLTGLPNYPSGKIHDGYGYFKNLEEHYQGIRIIRSWLIPRGNSSGILLMLNYLSFALFSSIWGLLKLHGKFDVIFVHEVSPIFVGIPALIMKWRFHAPVFFWILDLWPESLTAAGNVKNPFILKPIEAVVRFIYRYSDKLLIASQAFRQSVLSFNVSPDKLYYLPNWSEGKVLPAITADFKYTHLLPDGFKIMFAGNIGESQDFPAIIDAAEKIKENETIKWIIVGSGRKEEWVRSEIKKRGLEKNFFLLGHYPLDEIGGFITRADAMLVTLKKDPIFALTVPAKLQAYMAYGRPILTMLDGECSRIVSDAHAGLVASSGDAEQLANNILAMYNMSKTEITQIGDNALNYYQANFDRELILNNLEKLFTSGLRKK